MKRYFHISKLVCLIVFIDQVIKYIIRYSMTLGQSIPEGDTFVQLLYLRNDGIAFSLFEGKRWILVSIQLVLIIAIIIVMAKVIPRINSKLLTFSFSLMLGGGIGNFIDRLIFGEVIDYISVGSFPVFNFADSALTVGCVVMIIYLLTSSKDREKLEESIT